MPRFQDIPQLTQFSGYSVHVGWDYLPHQYVRHVEDYGLNVCPDFQRGYVWQLEQKVRYVEYVLRGGQSGRDLYFNAPKWQMGNIGPGIPDGWYVLVDGKQRLDAVLGFMNNEFPIFGGNFCRDYTDRLSLTHTNFIWHVNTLKTRDECLQWYIDLNSGGTVHKPEEIDRVRALLGHQDTWESPTLDEIRHLAGFDRGIIKKAILEERAREAERVANYEAMKLREQQSNRRGRRRGK